MDMADTKTSLVHDFKGQGDKSVFSSSLWVFLGVCIILGILTGFLLSQTKTGGIAQNSISGKTSVAKGTTIGSTDTKTFKDMAEGILQKGGIGDEGQFHLVRPGGESQYVYLTSSNVDLSQFVDKKIKVWGQTQKAQTAGWLMDVGRVEVE